MPFTISHAAATAPFSPLIRRFRLPLAAMVIGTMAPDFEYFIHLRTLALWGHSAVGLFVFCLPAGLLVLAAWEFLARAPVLDLLALPLDRRAELNTPAWWGRAAVAIIAGAATHVLWDSFTHVGRWGVRRLPVLNGNAASIGAGSEPWFIVLDQVSTVVGGAVVLGWSLREMWRADAFRTIVRSPWRWAVMLMFAAIAVAAGFWNGSR